MKRGSITPFCALSLMLVASLLFALLESSRIYGLERYATLKAETGMDSLCAEFQPLLWEQYGLLFLDGAYGTEQFSMAYVAESLRGHIEENCDTRTSIDDWTGLDLFSLTVSKIGLNGYALATDDEGELFLNYVAEREKESLPIGIAEDIYESIRQTEAVEATYSGIEESVVRAQSVLEIEKEGKEIPDIFGLESTWNSLIQMQNSSMLNLIFGDLENVSQKESKPKSDIQSRSKEEGNLHGIIDDDWYRKVLVMSYLEEYFSNYTSRIEDHFLDYEMEYVLSGKGTERENLEAALERVLLIREAANVAYLMQDSEKMALAETMASAVGLLVGGEPTVTKTIQLGIIGAWAYIESILDVRALVAGDVIPLIKSQSEWTTNTAEILTVFQENAKAKACADGLSYTDYLKHLIYLLNNECLAYRMMEVLEIGMQSQEEYRNCCMNHMIVAMNYEVQFESDPFFSSLVAIGNLHQGKFHFIKEVGCSYVP